MAHAEGGTLFLDEVDTLSPKAQVDLLRFLQDKTFRLVGSSLEQLYSYLKATVGSTFVARRAGM